MITTCSWITTLLHLASVTRFNVFFISDWSYSMPLTYHKRFAWHIPSENFDVHIFWFISPIQLCGRCQQGCARDLSSYILGEVSRKKSSALPERPAWKSSLPQECVCFIGFLDLQGKKVSTICMMWKWVWMRPAGNITTPLQLRSRTNPVSLWVGKSLLLT